MLPARFFGRAACSKATVRPLTDGPEGSSFAVRPDFFSDAAAGSTARVDAGRRSSGGGSASEAAAAYCGWPGGYSEGPRVASAEARALLRSNATWETGWSDLRHLPHAQTCLDAVNPGASAPGGPAPGSPGAPVPPPLVVPLLELHDLFLGGQFVPFTTEAAYVPLATAEAFGGLVQGTAPSATAGSRGPMGGIPADQCCLSRLRWATDERGELARELEAMQWMDPENLRRAPLIKLGSALVAHGGGWGDYQGGSGDNYFHTLQALASVAYLLPVLHRDPSIKLLIRICKDPWARIKKSFFDATDPVSSSAAAGGEPHGGRSGFRCGVERYALELLEILGVPLTQVKKMEQKKTNYKGAGRKKKAGSNSLLGYPRRAVKCTS